VDGSVGTSCPVQASMVTSLSSGPGRIPAA
jgi:hypothetical protein